MLKPINTIKLPKLGKQIFLFVFIGGICYVLVMGLLMLFVEQFGIEKNLANVLASLIVMVVNYFLNATFVFERGRLNPWKEASAFFLFAGIGFGINVVLYYLLTAFTPIDYLSSKTIVVILVAVFNFLTRKFLVFKG